MATQLPAAAAAALRFEETTLPSGLVLRVLPMPEYGSAHVIYSAGFGSIHRAFEKNGAHIALPAGIAHFLEHKMFESEDGVDAFTLYAATGAAANAYTSFDRTSYIFTATSEIDRNLDILLSMVGHPHFTPASVQKEQGIIGEEIKMYDDYPEVRLMFESLEALYHHHPVRDNIAGTVPSIAGITPEVLYSCTDAFYTPAGMVLAAAGNITMAQLAAAVQRAGLPAGKTPRAQAQFPDEPPQVAQAWREIVMPVALPMLCVGFKEAAPAGSTTKLEAVADMLTELICGESSTLYRRLYDEGLVQPGFGGEYGLLEGCFYFQFSGESPFPERVREALLAEIARLRREGVDAAQFETCQKMMYGESVSELQNVSRVASSLTSSYFQNRTPADELAAVAALTVADINDALQTLLQEERCATVVLRPEALPET